MSWDVKKIYRVNPFDLGPDAVYAVYTIFDSNFESFENRVRFLSELFVQQGSPENGESPLDFEMKSTFWSWSSCMLAFNNVVFLWNFPWHFQDS
jgi:hypothetical protein